MNEGVTMPLTSRFHRARGCADFIGLEGQRGRGAEGQWAGLRTTRGGGSRASCTAKLSRAPNIVESSGMLLTKLGNLTSTVPYLL